MMIIVYIEKDIEEIRDITGYSCTDFSVDRVPLFFIEKTYMCKSYGHAYSPCNFRVWAGVGSCWSGISP